MTPTARTLKHLRTLGATAGVVERRLPRGFTTVDFFGFADLIYVLGAHIVAVQCTSGSNHASRRKKILAEPRALLWLKAGGRIELHSWRKSAPRGRWAVRVEDITPADFRKADHV